MQELGKRLFGEIGQLEARIRRLEEREKSK